MSFCFFTTLLYDIIVTSDDHTLVRNRDQNVSVEHDFILFFVFQFIGSATPDRNVMEWPCPYPSC